MNTSFGAPNRSAVQIVNIKLTINPSTYVLYVEAPPPPVLFTLY